MSTPEIGHKVIVVVRRIVHNFLSGDGRVVGFPLYRYLVFSSLLSGVIQLIAWRPPESLGQVTPSWYVVTLTICQMVGSAIVLCSILAMENTPDAAQVERVGTIILATVGTVQMISLFAYYDRVPVAQSSWISFGFAVFCIVRAIQITKELALTKEILTMEESEGREVD